MKNKRPAVITKWVILGAVSVAALVILYVFLVINSDNYSTSLTKTPRANLTVVAALSIPTMDIGFLTITPTPTIDPGEVVDGISAQKYVKIEGTSGVGLRIRSAPGKNTDTKFIANESEVFIIIGGPQYADDLVWWEVTTPYDDTRQGWAAADYLVPLENQ